MGCGCGKKNTMPRRAALRPVVGPKAIQGGPAAGANPNELRALGMQNNVSLGQSKKMSEQRQKLEAIRRAAIQKRLK